MKKILLVLLVAVMASVMAYAWTTLTPITFGVSPEGRADSAKSDTFGWYTLAAASTKLTIYWRNTSTTANPLCSLVLQMRQGTSRDSMLIIRKNIKAIADSTDSTHMYTIWCDSQNIKQYRLLMFSKRDTTYHYIYTKEK